MKTLIFESYKEFSSRGDKTINGVSKEFAEKHPDYEEINKTNRGCWDCEGCKECVVCEDCVDCWKCKGCYNCLKCADCVGCILCDNCEDCVCCIGLSNKKGVRNG